MRPFLAYLHVIFAAVWLGCILTEALFERALAAPDHSTHLTLAELHVRVDKLVEVPAILMVLGTGAIMALRHWPASAWFHTMLWAGAAAIALNFFCVWLVFQRRSAAAAQAWSRFAELDRVQHRAGAGVLLLVLVAGAAGVLHRTVAS
jgi:hypothetical protein